MVDWRKYQERVADLFRELGCSAEVEASIRGARATHDIDVWVVFERFGLEHKWAVECKYWSTPISNETVLTLKSVVEDVGADKGIVVAESRFQPGAVSAATSTNILLATLGDLRSLAEDDLQDLLLEDLERKVIDLRERYHGLWEHEDLESGSTSRLRSGVESDGFDTAFRVSFELGLVEDGFRRLKVDRFPAPVGFDFDTKRPKKARDRREFLEMAGRAVQAIEDWVKRQEDNIEAALRGTETESKNRGIGNRRRGLPQEI